MTQAAIVPSFFLFGEPPRTVEGRFLHLEDLDERSRPNDWNIRPHAHADLNHVFHIVVGGGVMTVEGHSRAFTSPCLVLVPSCMVHGFAWLAETRGSVLTIADSYLRDLVAREPDFSTLFAVPRQLDLGQDSPIDASLRDLSRELVWRAPAGGAAIEARLLSILVEAQRLAVRTREEAPAHPGAYAGLVARFRALVERRYREGLPMEGLAAELGVTLGQLREACRKVAATSPHRLVQDRVMLEARRALLYSNMTVAEVGYHVGFDDPAYFSRFFAKLEGCSPRKYRLSRATAGRHDQTDWSSRGAKLAVNARAASEQKSRRAPPS